MMTPAIVIGWFLLSLGALWALVSQNEPITSRLTVATIICLILGYACLGIAGWKGVENNAE